MRGKLVAVYGPMFAGKTTYLIKTYGEGESAVVFKPDLDRRYTKRPVVISHDRYEIPAVLVNNDKPEEILELVGEVQRVFLDEANFFSSKLVAVVKQLIDSGKDVFVAGLTTYADGDPWGPMNEIIAIADKTKELSARCDGENGKCKNPATRSYRKISNMQKLTVAGADEYGAACEKHYKELHHKPKKSKQVV